MTSGEQPTGRREANKADRRRAILAAARASFLDRGYAGTSMSALLDTIGGSKATLWKYFPSKEALFAAVIDEVTADFRHDLSASLVAGRGLGESILLFCRRFVAALESPEGLATWRLLAAESVRSPELSQIFYERAIERVQHLLATMLGRFVAEGLLVPRPVPEMIDVLLNLCAGRQHRMMMADIGGMMDPDRAAQAYAEVFLRAYGMGAPTHPGEVEG